MLALAALIGLVAVEVAFSHDARWEAKEDGALALTVTEESVFVAWSVATGEPVFRIPYPAAHTASSKRRGSGAGGRSRRYALRVALGPRLSFERSMTETFLDLKTAPVERLPDEFLRGADEARKAFLARPASPRPAGAQP